MPAPAVAAVSVAIIIVIVTAVIFGSAEFRRRRFRRRLGPEFDRLVAVKGSWRAAAAELAERERRVRNLNIRPLPADVRNGYIAEWTQIQESFVDQPPAAASAAEDLVRRVLAGRGYPVDDYEQILADLSVDHIRSLEHYRAARGLSAAAANGDGNSNAGGSGSASTEDLRQALIHYRVIFDDLVGGQGAARTASSSRQANGSSPPAGGAGSHPPVPAADDDAADAGAATPFTTKESR
jgi:hypothetical protein